MPEKLKHPKLGVHLKNSYISAFIVTLYFIATNLSKRMFAVASPSYQTGEDPKSTIYSVLVMPFFTCQELCRCFFLLALKLLTVMQLLTNTQSLLSESPAPEYSCWWNAIWRNRSSKSSSSTSSSLIAIWENIFLIPLSSTTSSWVCIDAMFSSQFFATCPFFWHL